MRLHSAFLIPHRDKKQEATFGLEVRAQRLEDTRDKLAEDNLLGV